MGEFNTPAPHLPYTFMAISVGYETSLLKYIKIGFPLLLMTLILYVLCGFECYRFVGITKKLSTLTGQKIL
jgi:hypothetical protein